MPDQPVKAPESPGSFMRKIFSGAVLGHYGWLLVALMVAIFIGPLLQNHRIGVRFTDLLTGLVVIAGVLLATAGRIHLVIITVLGSVMMISSFVDPFVGTIATGVVAGCAGFLFLSYILITIMADIFSKARVSVDTLVGSVCGYLLLAALFASIYSVLVLFDNDCFFIQPQLEVPPNELHRQGTHFGVLTYYSIITLTTVGYGDIVPASPVARAIVSMEAVVGQIYLTVIVARLVGLHLSRTLIRQHEADHPHGTNP